MKFTQFSFFILIFFFFQCKQESIETISSEDMSQMILKNEKDVRLIMEKHLQAVTNRDLPTLKSTLSPDGKMQLILPSQDIISGVEAFMDFHEGWFEDKDWTFETEILNITAGRDIAMAVTELTYREPDRDGVPYFNRQIVSYVLQQTNGTWYVIKDHCTSAEKSTDNK